AMQGPIHPELGIAMDLSIQMKSEAGAICSLSLSFNNDGPYGSTVRYIGDTGTHVARRLSLEDGYGRALQPEGWDMSADGVEMQDRDFIAAITGGAAPSTSIEDVFDCYRVIGDIERLLPRGIVDSKEADGRTVATRSALRGRNRREGDH